MADKLLIIEDESLLGSELERYYARNGWEVRRAASLEEARHLLAAEICPLVVLSDMTLPDGNALDLLEERRESGPVSEWILLTGYGSVPDSVRALRLGAYDFLEKPCDLQRLDLVIAGAARSARAQRRLRRRDEARVREYSPDAFLGHSGAATEVRRMLARLAAVPYRALIIAGETGTGKGLAARILHHSGSRSGEAFTQINCAALPAELLESELFGHEAGAFAGARGRHRGVFERADGGTLFLDEIAEMKADLQAKLLQSIDEQRLMRIGGERELEVDVQVIAATNRNIEDAVAAGDLREDLYHRLSVFRLDLPALRRRKEDLDDLVPELIAEFNAEAGKRVVSVREGVWQRLRAHDWPGNVRELRNVVERCVLFAEDEKFPERWLQLGDGRSAGQARGGSTSATTQAEGRGAGLALPLDGSMSLEAMERLIIQTALERHDFNVSATARALATTRETLRYRIQRYGLRTTKR